MTTSSAFVHAVTEQIHLAERAMAAARARRDETGFADAAGRLADLREIAHRNAPVPVRSLVRSRPAH
jgi:hypothetical protein